MPPDITVVCTGAQHLLRNRTPSHHHLSSLRHIPQQQTFHNCNKVSTSCTIVTGLLPRKVVHTAEIVVTDPSVEEEALSPLLPNSLTVLVTLLPLCGTSCISELHARGSTFAR